MPGKMDCYGVSDIGRKRDSNQDHFLVADLRKSIDVHHSSLGYDNQSHRSGASRAKLLLVADGMGGHSGGERASWLAVQGVVQYLLTSLHWPINCEPDHEADFFKGLNAALLQSQMQIQAVAESHPQHNHMGTTLTMAWVVWPHAYLIHVGDSRAYLFRNGELQQLSHDQTLAQALADKGLIPPEKVADHQYSNVLTSVLGCNNTMEPLYSRFELQADDKLLLCSDGLTLHLDDSQIAQLLGTEQSAETTCQQLIATANDAGGGDNITVVLAGFVSKTSDTGYSEAVAEQPGTCSVCEATLVD